jgi:ppGpp synthetase/RelA/SpoT-type nucleotidyltranferase
MGKPRLLVSAPGMPRDQMNQVQAEMADPNTDQYIWIFDKPVDSKELQIQAQSRFDDYGDNVDAHIDIAMGFASKVISNPSGFSYSGSQTPFDVLDQRMTDMQKDASELLVDNLLKPLAESWGFKEFEEMEVEITFTPNVKRLTMEDIRGLDPESVAPKEKRKMYEKLNIPLDDTLYDEYQNELKQDKTDQKDIGMAQAQANGFGGGQEGGGQEGGGSFGNSPAEAGNPPKAGGGKPPSEGGQSEKSGAGQSDVPPIKPLNAEPVTPEQPDNAKDRPAPPRTDKQEPSPFRKKKGEAITAEDIGNIVAKAVEATIRANKAEERIPLPPKAGSNANDSVDLYVSQGLDTPGRPEITDPKIRATYGEDDDEFEDELPINAPQKRASVKQSGGTSPYEPPVLDPQVPERDLMREEKKHGAGDFTNQGDVGIPQVDSAGRIIEPHTPEEFPAVGLNDYVNELEDKAGVKGDAIKGGLGNDGIDQDSTGDFKDPHDLAQQSNEPPEPETGQQTQSTNIGPRVGEPVEGEPDDLGRDISGGYQPDEPDLKRAGSNIRDEPPYEKSEGFPKDNNPEELRKLVNRQDLRGEGIGDNYPNHPQTPDPPEAYHKDKIKPEDSDPRLPMVDPNPELNQPQKGQARLDDSPLFEQPTNNPEGIDPSRDRYQQGMGTTPSSEEPHDLKNDITQGGGDGNAVPPADPVLGQSDQVRLQRDELTGTDDHSKLPTIGDPLKDQAEHPDNTDVIDQSGLNLTPGAPSGDVEDPYRDQVTGITDPVLGEPDLQNQTIQDPIGEVPQDDGMLLKPEDVQQVQPQNADPTDPNVGGIDVPAPGADPNQGTNVDQGVDPNEIDPNQLHVDPETGTSYTDQTDEQGNEVPDLRFDQTPDSDEKQPDVELDNEIVTKEEYEQELEAQRASQQGIQQTPDVPQQPPMISEDEFNAELDRQSEDPNESNIFDNTKPEEPEGRIQKMLNPEEEEEEGWEPAFKEDKEKPELSKEVADGMRIQSEQVFVNPDGKVIGAPRFYDNRKKKDQSRETGTSSGAKKGWDTRGRGRKEEPKKGERGTVNDSRLQERKQAISDITNTFPKLFDHIKAEQQSIKAEKIQEQHYERVKEVYNNLNDKFPKVEVTARVKTTYSMLEKTARKSDEYPDVSDVADVSALRTMCKNLKEIGEVSKYIRENFDVVEEENYIQKSKGGYRSIHMQIKDKNGLLSEVQVRTPNQETWANWSHDNFYKPLDEGMKAFIESHYVEIETYAERMSDYYYKVDNGEEAEQPECPPELTVKMGCME